MLLQSSVSLKPYNTFGIEAKAKYFASFSTIEELQDLLREPLVQSEEKLVVGGGSNLLLTRDFDGVVLLNKIAGIEVLHEDEEQVLVRSGAGVVWHDLVQFCIGRGYAGIENLSLIPGTVGAAPMQNIGAYGVELKETFESLEAVEIATGKMKTFDRSTCRFGYRTSIFKTSEKGRYIITHVTLRLQKKPNFNISYGAVKTTLEEMNVSELSLKAVSDAVCHIRRSKLPDPAVIGNAGSFFKNPEIPQEQFQKLQEQHPGIPHYPAPNHQVKVPAGWLIEQCGWKGKRLGSYGVHEHQALVLVNYGGAEGRQLRELASDIIRSVEVKFGITLEPEVNVY